MNSDYSDKFEASIRKSFYPELDQDTRDFIRHISFKYRLTFQEIGKLIGAARDLDMWDEMTIRQWMEETFPEEPDNPLTVQGVKQVMNHAEASPVADGLSRVALWNAAFFPSKDLAEAMRAFQEKRPPKFTGE